MIFIFLYSPEKAHGNKEKLVVKIQDLVVNHKSRPLKSNPEL